LWKSGIPALADTKFEYTQSSFNDISKATMTRALKVIQLAGGKVTATDVVIPEQTPIPAPLEQWSMGIPDRGLSVKDPAWSWKGNWKQEMAEQNKSEVMGKTAIGAGAEATLKFTGSAVALQGDLTEFGGRADVYVDGKKVRDADAYMVERTHDAALWHIYGLPQGQHTVRLVTRDDADPRSKGKKVTLRKAIVYVSK